MENSNPHNEYMARCLELAQNGSGNVAPNPMVGAVIVNNGRIIGEGYHAQCGEPHAEINAINSVKDKTLLADSTLYVSLEACSHFGKTPPCTQRILDEKIPRVVFATTDPNPKVSGRGVEMLRQEGVDVTVGVLEDEAKELNRKYMTFHTLQRPYIIFKWAQTLDGFIDKVRQPGEKPEWITNDLARSLVHKWRSEEQAIIAGTNTIEKDNPQLNVRCWNGKNPVRVIVDRRLRLPRTANVFDGSQQTLLFMGNNSNALARKSEFAGIDNLELVVLDFAKNIETQMLKELAERQIISAIIEGGATFMGSFIKKDLWDEARVFIGNRFFGQGIVAPALQGKLHMYNEIGDSKLFIYRPDRG